MNDAPDRVPRLIDAFRSGDVDAGNELLGHYRPWLNLLARLQCARRDQAKSDASDIVQQTLLQAFQAFPQFAGTTEAELQAWLRRILARALSHELRRHYGTQKRGAARELSIERDLADSSQRLQAGLAADESSPSERGIAKEQAAQMAQVLERLPPDYREVLILRNLEGLPHDEIARRMKRPAGAVRMLWVRALARLRKELETPPG